MAIWGLGREGRAAIGLIRRCHPSIPLLLLDDRTVAPAPPEFDGVACAFGPARIAEALGHIDVIVKSPGVSLYRSEIRAAQERGVAVTSLLNLWFAEPRDLTTICVTGTKGKSTTAALIAHVLTRLGRKAALVGNIGVPITETERAEATHAVIEVSSYQAADFSGTCDVGVLTSLYPEHPDWHLSIDNYYRDKINLLRHSRCRIISHDSAATAGPFLTTPLSPISWFDAETGIHSCGTDICDAPVRLGHVGNPYLARAHNRSNLCAALTVAKALGVDPAAALAASADFAGLPHRQQELGSIAGVLFVDDSISTIPQSTIAALAVYAGRDIAVIVGGFDRGLDYRDLVAELAHGAAKAVICLGPSGQRIFGELQTAAANCAIHLAPSMADAVDRARHMTAPGGVVLLSPAAPSYGTYRDFAERGRDFAYRAGFALPSVGGHG